MRGGSRILPEFFHVTKDVLVHDDRIINHDPDRQNQRQHRDIVQGETHVMHKQKRWDDGRGDRQSCNYCGPPVADEQQDRGRHENRRKQQVKVHFRHRFTDESCLILNDLDLNVSRQGLLNPCQPNLNGVRDRYGVCSGLPLHKQADGVLPIQSAETTGFFDGIFGPADIFDSDGVPAAIGDNQFVKLAGRLHATESPQDQFSRSLIHDSAGDFHVLRDQCLTDFFDRQIE